MTNTIDGWQYRFEGVVMQQSIASIYCFGRHYNIVLIRYMLVFASRMTQYYDTD